MSVTNVILDRGISFVANVEKTRLSGSITRQWKIETDDETDGAITIINESQSTISGFDNPIPARWSTYNFGVGEIDANLYLQRLDFRQDSQRLKRWFATGLYLPLPTNQSSGDSNTDPLSRPVKYWIEPYTTTEIITQAYNVSAISRADGTTRAANTFGPIQNAAFEDYDEPLERTKTRIMLVAQKNYASYTTIANLQLTYGNTVNSVTYNGYAPHYVKFHSAVCSPVQNEAGVSFYTGTIRLIFSDTPWYHEVVNRGYKVMVDDGGGSFKQVNATDDNGQFVSEPVLLQADGQRLDGTPGNVIQYRDLEAVSYAGLGV